MRATWAVMIFDRAHHGERCGEFIVRGFPSRALAREYATRRMRDSIEELRTPGQSEKETREIWDLYGEGARVLGDDGYQDESDAWFRDIATAKRRDWQATLTKSGLPA